LTWAVSPATGIGLPRVVLDPQGGNSHLRDATTDPGGLHGLDAIRWVLTMKGTEVLIRPQRQSEDPPARGGEEWRRRSPPRRERARRRSGPAGPPGRSPPW